MKAMQRYYQIQANAHSITTHAYHNPQTQHLKKSFRAKKRRYFDKDV